MMPIEIIRKKSATKSITVGLEVSGMTLRVTPGEVVIGEKRLDVTEPFEHQVEAIPDKEVYVGVYVAESKQGGALELVVDEVPGGSFAYDFGAPSSQYISHACLVLGKLAAGATSLDSTVWNFRPVERVT